MENKYENVKDLINIFFRYVAPNLYGKTVEANGKKFAVTVAEVFIHDTKGAIAYNDEDELSFWQQEDIRQILHALNLHFGKVSYFNIKEAIYTTDHIKDQQYICNFLMQLEVVFV